MTVSNKISRELTGKPVVMLWCEIFVQYGCILSHKLLRANCLGGNLDYILMAHLLTLCIWIWVCDRLDNRSANTHSHSHPPPSMASWRSVLPHSVLLGLALQLALPSGTSADVTEAETGNVLVLPSCPSLCFCQQRKVPRLAWWSKEEEKSM